MDISCCVRLRLGSVSRVYGWCDSAWAIARVVSRVSDGDDGLHRMAVRDDAKVLASIVWCVCI